MTELSQVHAPAGAQPPVRRSRLRSPATAWSVLIAGILAAAVFASDPRQPRDDNGVRETVQSQLQAFAALDATKAFALADPTLRTRFHTPEEFLDTVRSQYPMVLKPASVLFLKAESDGTIALQKVRLTDTEGTNWVVTYLLNRGGDQQWRISGCVVEPDGPQVMA